MKPARDQADISHSTAVLIIASVATVWVGGLMSIRFTFTNSQAKPALHMVRYVYG
jgi:hypothetical protein